MDSKTARKIDEALSDEVFGVKNLTGSYIDFLDFDMIMLDGEFTLEQLRDTVEVLDRFKNGE